MRATTHSLTNSPGLRTSAVVARRPAVPESLLLAPRRPVVKALCSFCLAEYPNHPEDGVENASVQFHGVLACGFHAEFVWGDMPAQEAK